MSRDVLAPNAAPSYRCDVFKMCPVPPQHRYEAVGRADCTVSILLKLNMIGNDLYCSVFSLVASSLIVEIIATIIIPLATISTITAVVVVAAAAATADAIVATVKTIVLAIV